MKDIIITALIVFLLTGIWMVGGYENTITECYKITKTKKEFHHCIETGKKDYLQINN